MMTFVFEIVYMIAKLLTYALLSLVILFTGVNADKKDQQMVFALLLLPATGIAYELYPTQEKEIEKIELEVGYFLRKERNAKAEQDIIIRHVANKLRVNAAQVEQILADLAKDGMLIVTEAGGKVFYQIASVANK
jgi:hypothetical protein